MQDFLCFCLPAVAARREGGCLGGRNSTGRFTLQTINGKRASAAAPWIRVRVPAQSKHKVVDGALQSGGLNTVCHSACCPNKHECFGRGTATMMILGDTCTRDCAFCAVRSGRPLPPDPDEPRRVAEAASKLGLGHVVVTSVTRDDLSDGGAGIFAATIRALRERIPAASVEVLTPDFLGREKDISTVLTAQPDVFNHNLETVRRLQPDIRPQAGYERSLGVLRFASEWKPALATKSGLMVGLGETDDEVFEAMEALRATGCGLLTVGQYLAPSASHAPVVRYVHPDVFERYRQRARTLGFKAVASGPLVRSSYKAGELLDECARA